MALEPAIRELDVPAPRRDGTVADLVRYDLAASTTRLLRHEHSIRVGAEGSDAEPASDQEDVHQARVATRRWRSTLRTFTGMVDQDWAARLSEELGWLAGLLGAVRDADVMLASLERDAAGLPESERAVARSMLGRLVKARAADHQHLLGAMAGEAYASLVRDLVAAAQAPAFTPEAAQPAVDAVGPLVARRSRRLRRAVRDAGDDPGDDALHQIRIRAKRCRYASEAVAPVAGDPAVALARALAKLQDVLGEQHDAVVAQDWLRQAASSARRQEAFVAGQLAAAERSRADEARAAWPLAWKAASRKRLRSWL